MKDILTRLLDAHVEYEMNRLTGSELRESVEDEVKWIFEWMKGVKLKNFITRKRVLAFIHDNVVELPVAGGVTELAGEMSRRVLESDHNEHSTLQDIFPHDIFFEFVDKLIHLKSTREDLIRKTVSTGAYSELLSHVLFTGIKEFLLTENIIARKVPGLSLLVQIGKEAVNRAVPGLEPAVEDRVREYISKNLGMAINASVNFLYDYYDEEHIYAVAEEVWENIAFIPLARHFETLSSEDMEDFIVTGYDFWMQFRETRYFKGIYTEIVNAFFDKYGDKELDILVDDMGVSQDLVINNIVSFAEPLLKKSFARKFLKERLMARFESFYRSKKARAIARPPVHLKKVQKKKVLSVTARRKAAS